jgi:hypothetical protein
MEKLNMLENQIHKIRQERLKVERRIKLREAHELQSNALRGRTLENELKLIQKEKAQAEKRNRKLMHEIMESINSFKDEVGYSSLKRSKLRLKDAKISFAEIIMSHFPQWAEALQDPISFEKQIYAKSLDVLRQRHEKSKEDFKKKMDVHQDIVRTQLEYIEEMKKEHDVSMERDRILQFMQMEKEEKSQKLAELQSVYQRRLDDIMKDQQSRKQTMLQNASERLEKTMIEEPSPAHIYKMWNLIQRPGTQPAPIQQESRAMTPMMHIPYDLETTHQLSTRPQAPNVPQAPQVQTPQISRPGTNEKYEFADLMNRESPEGKREVIDPMRRNFTFGEAEMAKNNSPSRKQPQVIMVNPEEVSDNVEVYITPEVVKKPQERIPKPDISKQVIKPEFVSQNQVPIPVIQKEPPKVIASQKPKSVEVSARVVSEPKAIIPALPKFSEDEEPDFNIVTVPRNPEPVNPSPTRVPGRAVPVSTDFGNEQPLVISSRSQDKEFEIKTNPMKTGVQVVSKSAPSNVKILKPTEETLASMNRQVIDPASVVKPANRVAVPLTEDDIEPPVIIQQDKSTRSQVKVPQIPIADDSEFVIVQQNPSKQPMNIVKDATVSKSKPTGEPQVIMQQPIAIPKEKAKAKPQPPHLDLSSAKQGMIIEATTSPIDVPVIQSIKKPENVPVSNLAQSYSKKGKPEDSRMGGYSVPMYQTQIPEAPRIEEESLENTDFESLYLKGVIERAITTPQSRSRSGSTQVQNRIDSVSSQKSVDVSMSSSGPLRFNDLSARLSPTSSMSSSSRMLDAPTVIIESNVIANIDPYQRVNCLNDLISTAKQQFTSGGVKNLNIKDKIPSEKLDSIASKYLENGRLDIRSPEDLIMFIAAAAKNQNSYFLPYDIARSKKPVTEEMMISKMYQTENREIYRILKDFFLYCIRSNILTDKVATGIFIDTMVNYRTTKNQWNRATEAIQKFISDSLQSGSLDTINLSGLQSPDRPLTPNRVTGRADDRSFSSSRGPKPPLTPGRVGTAEERSVTPNRAGLGSQWKMDKTSSANMRSGNSGSMGEVSRIEDFEEIDYEY